MDDHPLLRALRARGEPAAMRVRNVDQRDMEVVRAVDEAPPSDDTQPATPRTGVGDHLSLHWGTSFGLMGVHGGHIRDPTALLIADGQCNTRQCSCDRQPSVLQLHTRTTRLQSETGQARWQMDHGIKCRHKPASTCRACAIGDEVVDVRSPHEVRLGLVQPLELGHALSGRTSSGTLTTPTWRVCTSSHQRPHGADDLGSQLAARRSDAPASLEDAELFAPVRRHAPRRSRAMRDCARARPSRGSPCARSARACACRRAMFHLTYLPLPYLTLPYLTLPAAREHGHR